LGSICAGVRSVRREVAPCCADWVRFARARAECDGRFWRVWALRDKVAFVVEDEKCADALRNLNLPATASAHGAGAADKSDWTPLAGKPAVILPDNDDPGCRRALAHAADLKWAMVRRAADRLAHYHSRNHRRHQYPGQSKTQFHTHLNSPAIG
jgi:hypothetical protein